MYCGTKLVTVENYHYGTLFSASEVSALIGRGLDMNRDAVSVCNGDLSVGDFGMSAYLTKEGRVDLRFWATTTSLPASATVRVSYIYVAG